MIRHIAHSRLVVMEGQWNAESDRYEPMADDSFTLLLRKDRLYSLDKATPIHLGGDEDEHANRNKLINDRFSRGRKVLRCARNVQGSFLHFTVSDTASQPASQPMVSPWISTCQSFLSSVGTRARRSGLGLVRRGRGLACCRGAGCLGPDCCGWFRDAFAMACALHVRCSSCRTPRPRRGRWT